MHVEDSLGLDISVVITTCSRAPILRGALQSLFAQRGVEGLRIELVVVDDASTDNTREVLAELAAISPFPLRVVSGERRGVAAARNLGARAAAGTWIASFDDDELAVPEWLSLLYTAAQSQGADVVGGATYLQLPDGHTLAEFGPRARVLLGECEPGGGLRPYPAGALPATNNVLFRRSLHATVDGYDARLTEGGEDVDFFARLQQRGASLWLEPAARAAHLIPEKRIAPGAIEQTGNPLDVALQGDGYFAVDTPAGERYTRAGAFQINNAGTLVDLSGNPVLTEAGPVTFTAADGDILIDSSGNISTN